MCHDLHNVDGVNRMTTRVNDDFFKKKRMQQTHSFTHIIALDEIIKWKQGSNAKEAVNQEQSSKCQTVSTVVVFLHVD